MTETIDIVMPVYDSPVIVKQTLDSLFKSTHDFQYQFRFLVCNDGSPGSSEEWDFLRNAADKYIEHPTNQGISASLNDLMREATSDWVIIVESDTLVPSNWFNRVLEERDYVVEHFPKAKWIGFKIVDLDGGMVFYYRDLDQAGNTIGLPLGKDAKAPYYNVLRKVTHVSNVCSIIHRKTFFEIGMADEKLRKQWVDSDIGMALNMNGHHVVVDPNLSFVHNKPHVSSNQEVADYQYFLTKWGNNYERNQKKS